MTAQEWQLLKDNIPDYWKWPEVWGGCVLGAISGVLLLEVIIVLIKVI